ncbi:hypothetical protein AB6A40_000654 [Gnathostoma spinigerum]|uniref:Rab-GAP TBC domain-containing protein n=1 Tax=Gnathostoma spinigerum TaxID=75299 RepID=A0ABD6E3I3_9BILA
MLTKISNNAYLCGTWRITSTNAMVEEKRELTNFKDWKSDVELLSALQKWRGRISSSSFDPTQCCELEALLDQRFITGKDCALRRTFLNILESILIGIWRKTFGRSLPNDLCKEFVLKIIYMLKTAVVDVAFSSGNVWFGGVIESCSSTGTLSSFPFISSVFLSSAIGVDLAGSLVVTDLIKSSTKFYDNPDSFSRALFDNDERCLAVLTSLLHLKIKHLSLPDQFHPSILYLKIFNLFGYNYDVLLDWIHSDVLAIPFILWFCKDICANFDEYNTLLQRWPNQTETVIGEDDCSVVADIRTEKCDIELQFVQYQGLKKTKISHTFGAHRQHSSSLCLMKTSIPVVQTSQSVLEMMNDCLIRLRVAAQRMCRLKMAPFNLTPLISVIERVEDVFNSRLSQAVD